MNEQLSISPTFYEQLYLYKSDMRSFFELKVWLYTFLAEENLRKSCSKNVVENDNSSIETFENRQSFCCADETN
jgi:hypothetical protein